MSSRARRQGRRYCSNVDGREGPGSNAELSQNNVCDVRVGCRPLDEYAAFAGEKDASLRWVDGRRAVGTLHQAGVEGDAFGGGIEEELHWVIARLAMDVDGSRECRRLGVVGPPVVCLPAIRFAD